MPAPAASVPWTSAWARNTTPTVSQWVAHIYPTKYQAFEVQRLKLHGLRAIAHRTWFAADDDQADVTLLSFRTSAGALDRYTATTTDRAESSFPVPGAAHAIGFTHSKVDRLGNIPAIVYAVKGTFVVEMFYFSPGRLRTRDAVKWMTIQLARLP